MIESGHFRFHVVGERILPLDPRLFYKHRGLERAAEGADVAGGASPSPQRACAACAVANTVAYAQAVEDALGLGPTVSCGARARCCSSSSASTTTSTTSARSARASASRPATMAFAALKDRAQRINEALAGHRFLFGTRRRRRRRVRARRSARPTPRRGALRELRADAAAAWRELEFAGSVQARLAGVGVLDAGGRAAPRRRAVPPRAPPACASTPARASPRLAYGGFAPAAPREATGDVAARAGGARRRARGDVRPARRAAGRAARAGTAAPRRGAPRAARRRPRREPARRDARRRRARGRTIARLRLRTGSYANWPVLAHAAAGNLLPDFPLINKSFELCYACVDR